MTLRYVYGDLLTGRIRGTLQALDGPWSEALNAAGAVACTVSLRTRAMRRLDLAQSAEPARTFLAVFDGETCLQAGPIWSHEWSEDSGRLTLVAGGMWTYFDHRVLLPVLAGRLPSDPTTDTRFMPVSADPDYPWPTDTRTSLQGIAVALVAQAKAETNGNVPVVLPSPIAGPNQRAYRGSDTAWVGERLLELSRVAGGPDIRFTPRLTTDKLHVEWVMEVGTPAKPMLASDRDVVFWVGTKAASVSGLTSKLSGARIGNRAFSSGGNAADETLVAVATDPTLGAAGFPALDLIDSQRSTVSQIATLQDYATQLARRGRRPSRLTSFSHNLDARPFLSSFRAGDFAQVRVKKSLYLPVADLRMRITARSGNVTSKNVSLTFQPEEL
jgi:hypothetical protein